MISLFMQMEPRQEEKGTVIFNELDEVNEMIFNERGSIDVGFQITKKNYMCVRINQGSIICGFNCMANKKNQFVYKAVTKIEGYMLRKHVWFDLMDSFERVASILKLNVKNHFVNKIQKKVEW